MPIALPVIFGLAAGITHGIVSDAIDLSIALNQSVTLPFFSQSLSD